LAGLLLFSGCATAGQGIEIASVVDAKANLAGYKTYDWLASAEVLRDPYGDWVPRGFDVDKEIRWLIDKQLRKKNMVYAVNAPDAYVAYIIGVNMDTQAEQIQAMFGKKADLSNLTAGALLILLIDSETENVIWAGAAVAQAKTNPTDEQVRARLAAAVDKIFKLFHN
jgi:hypothetical protein